MSLRPFLCLSTTDSDVAGEGVYVYMAPGVHHSCWYSTVSLEYSSLGKYKHNFVVHVQCTSRRSRGVPAEHPPQTKEAGVISPLRQRPTPRSLIRNLVSNLVAQSHNECADAMSRCAIVLSALRPSPSVAFCLSVSFCLHVSFYLFLFLSAYFCISVCFGLWRSLSVFLFLSVSLSVCLSLSVFLSLSISYCPFRHISVSLSLTVSCGLCHCRSSLRSVIIRRPREWRCTNGDDFVFKSGI